MSVPAADMTREWLTHHAGDPDFASAMQVAEVKFRVKEAVFDAIQWGRLYGGAIMLLGVADASDPEELLEPFEPEKTRPDQLRYLRVLDRWRAVGDGAIDNDIQSPNFDFPVYYSIVGTGNVVRVHHTRVLRFDGDSLPWYQWIANARWNDSVLQAAEMPIKDVTTATQAIVSMLHEANFDVIKTPMLTELLSAFGDEGAKQSALQKRFAAVTYLKSWMRAIVLGDEESYETKTHSFAEIASVLEKLQITVSGAVDIPFTRLYGQSPSGLTATGESDLQNYYNKIASDQETKLRPRLATLFEVIARSECGGYPDDYRFEFNPLWKEPGSIQATKENMDATRDNTYIAAGVVTPSIVARKLKTLGVYDIPDDAIELLEETEKNPPPPPEGFGGPPIPGEKPAFGKGETTQNGAPEGETGEDISQKEGSVASPKDGWEDQPRDERGRFGSSGTGGTGLTEGRHVEKLAMRANTRASLRAALQAVVTKAGLHAALAKYPLRQLAVVKATQCRKDGELRDSRSSGVYDYQTKSIQVKGTRQPGSWGKTYTPGETHSMSQAAKTHDEAIARTALHEIGHHLFHQDETLKAAAQAAYDSHATRTINGRTEFEPRGFSKYAEKSPSEYMSEALVAYVYHRDALKAHDPVAHDLAAKLVSARGLKVRDEDLRVVFDWDTEQERDDQGRFGTGGSGTELLARSGASVKVNSLHHDPQTGSVHVHATEI